MLRASKMVKRGVLIVYPTDTVYGLGCDPYNPVAVEKVFHLKARRDKPLPVLCSSVEKVHELVDLHGLGLKLAKKFWPGALTIVATIKVSNLPPLLSLSSPKLGVRVPNLDCARKLIELCGGYLVGTSANRSGSKPPRRAEEALHELGDAFDALVDGGPTPIGRESTVVDVADESVKVIREGVISAMEVLNAIR